MAKQIIDDSHKYTVVASLGDPGAGGAFHDYVITAKGKKDGSDEIVDTERELGRIHFQEGPILESGVNGVMMEDLLAINIDRLRGFQSGAYAHPKNQEALDHLDAALAALKDRTAEREERNVEGTSTV